MTVRVAINGPPVNGPEVHGTEPRPEPVARFRRAPVTLDIILFFRYWTAPGRKVHVARGRRDAILSRS